MYQGHKLAVVIPAYNEESLISETVKRMPDYADKIYVINDGSTDNTRQIIESLVDGRITLINHEFNQGPGYALVSGYKHALEDKMDIVVKMDGDGQMGVQYLPDLLAPIIDNKADYTKGNRPSKLSHRKGMSNWRYFGNWLLTLLTRIASGYWHISDPQNGYTAITRRALGQIMIDNIYGYYGYLNDILVRLKVSGCRVIDVPMQAYYGKEKSKIRYGKYIPKVSFLLLRRYIWRLKVKFFKQN